MDFQKLEFLNRSVKFADVGRYSISLILKVGPLQIKVKYQSESLESCEALEYHLSAFITHEKPSSPDIIINYVALPGEVAKMGLWQDIQAEWRVYPRDDGFSVIQRDFVGVVNRDLSLVRAWGPAVSHECMDSIDNILTLCVSKNLPRRGALIIHGATVLINNEAYVFYGQSGAGKSTLAKLSMEKLGLDILSSDQIYLQQKEKKLWAVATPITIPEFPRRHPNVIKGEAPVRALIHLENRGQWGGRKLSKLESLREVLKETFYLRDFSSPPEILNLLTEIHRLDSVETLEMCYPLGESYLEHLFSMMGEPHEERKKASQEIQESLL